MDGLVSECGAIRAFEMGVVWCVIYQNGGLSLVCLRSFHSFFLGFLF